ncbi:hypothetical protein NS277_04230 [Novosphingobium barchaimii]|nr:hypothetical protein NS277_04230 [Novosphingobium barchaimii]
MAVSGMFAPYFGGGAEFSSFNLATWLSRQGHEVGVFTSAPSIDTECDGEYYEGLRIWRKYMPRPYSIHDTGNAASKLKWHLQDHLDPRNKTLFSQAVDAFKPDFINLHILQGIGLNLIDVINERKIPVLYFQHDLGLVCIKRSMFRKGGDCEKQCTICKISSSYQYNKLKKVERMTICSPSQANLDKISRFFPLEHFTSRATLNASTFPEPTVERAPSEAVRLLYVGRIYHTKGINVLLSACERLIEKYNFTLTIVGGGPEEKALRAAYGNRDWVSFTGAVPQAEVSNHMVASDMLCFPSIWAEPLGGVALHALTLGVPVLGSDRGGIPELVQHDRNGMLIPAGDLDAWTTGIEYALKNPEAVHRWSEFAREQAPQYSQDNLGSAIFSIMQNTIAMARHQEATS